MFIFDYDLNSFRLSNRRSAVLAKPEMTKKVIQMIHSHIDTAKKQEIDNQALNQKKTSGITPKTTKSISEKEAKQLMDVDNEDKDKQNENENANDNKDEDQDEAQHFNDMDKDSDEDDGSPPPPGNGGKTDKYVWTQTLSEVELTLEIDANLRGKNLKIVIKKRHLLVAIKGKESEPIIDGKLSADVDTEESTWTLDKDYKKSTKTLTITLTKIKGMSWWDCVIIGDPKINTSKIEPENSKLDSLDADTRQTVEKMMFDQRQKMRGLPTSKEIEQQKILEKFKAQHPEMDFSNLKMAPPHMANKYGNM